MNTGATEIETKLVPPRGFVIPDLSDVLDGPAPTGGRPEQVQPQRLIDHYLDTDDLVLARSSITLRYRSGPNGGGWTAKLPTRSHGSHHLRRHRIDVDGELPSLPPEVWVLVAARVRHRTLRRVAELLTTRTVQRLETPQGSGLVEIVTDHVRGERTDGRILEFDEIGVRQLGGPGARSARRAAVAELRRSGCRRGPQLAKLQRVLGAEELGSPEVVVPTLPSHPKVPQVVGTAVARSVDQILLHDPLVRLGEEVEDLHQLRVGVRRLRSDLRTFAGVLDGQSTARLRAELRWVADATNALRDLDVLRARLVHARSQVPVLDEAAIDELLSRCNEQSELARVEILEVLSSDRYLDLLDELVATTRELVDPKRPALRTTSGRDQLRRAVRRRWKQLDRQIRRLERDPDPVVLHRTRIVVKRCRAALEATRPVLGAGSGRTARDLGRLQDVLGDIHDDEVAQEWLRRAGADEPSTALVAGQIIASVRADEARLWTKWPKAWRRVQRRRRKQ